MSTYYSDSTSGLRRYNSWCDSSNRGTNAVQSNFKITKGVIEGLVGMESPEHIGMSYNVRLIDTGHLIKCRRLVDNASFDGVGEYSPLEEGDPVIIAYKEGMLQDGIILGSFYTEGTYKDFYIKGNSVPPKSNPSDSTESNQPSIHPNRIAQPDAWFHMIGGKVSPYRDPALTDGSSSHRASKRPFPASIQLKNKMGDVAQYARGDIIFYSDSNIILFSSQEGKSKCKRLKELAIYYQEMVDELERFVGTSIKDESITDESIESKSTSLRSLINGDSINDISFISTDIIKSYIDKLSLNVDKSDINKSDIDKDDDRRNRRHIDGRLTVDYMMWAPMIEYHIPQLKAMVSKCKELYITCKEDSLIENSILNKQIEASAINNSATCSYLTSGKEVNDEYIENISQGKICKKDGVIHYPFIKWKLNKEEGDKLGDYASIDDIKEEIVHKKTLQAFIEMSNKAKEESNGTILLAIASAYRDEHYLNKYGLGKRECDTPQLNLKLVAPINNSEHLTGYGIDVVDKNDSNTFSLNNTYVSKAWTWLENNCNKYGFEISFPKGNKQGLDYEPWHLRYIKDIPEDLALVFSYAKEGGKIDKITQDKLCNTSPKQESVEHTQDKEIDRNTLDLDKIVGDNSIDSLTIITGEDVINSKKGNAPFNVGDGFKLIIAEIISTKLSNKEITLEDNIEVIPSLIVENEGEFKEGKRFSLRFLLENMLEKDGTSSANLLANLIGKDEISNKIKSLNYSASAYPNKSSTFELCVSLYRLSIEGEGNVYDIIRKSLSKNNTVNGMNKGIVLSRKGYSSITNTYTAVYKNTKGYFIISAINTQEGMDENLTNITKAFNQSIKVIDDLEINGI